eukprot:CAMPEP_0119336562 /NCGR_PEP_ID=MMETSP1333-20130426/92093_1 /TAXON_ID=418940 /ORGANISM="Scyphosphaera apsteinii, Strain RCC1455" /LENGTH=201 /DNA_ID=CAMNT_0007347385 /DNA_START=458 /DNA_END=1065 /DNA_ORIENTATION=+
MGGNWLGGGRLGAGGQAEMLGETAWGQAGEEMGSKEASLAEWEKETNWAVGLGELAQVEAGWGGAVGEEAASEEATSGMAAAEEAASEEAASGEAVWAAGVAAGAEAGAEEGDILAAVKICYHDAATAERVPTIENALVITLGHSAAIRRHESEPPVDSIKYHLVVAHISAANDSAIVFIVKNAQAPDASPQLIHVLAGSK